MIQCKDRVTTIEGSPREIVLDLASILISFRTTLEKEYKMTEDEIMQIVNKCGYLAFANKEEIIKELDNMAEEEI